MSFLESIHCQFELSQEESLQEISKISKIRMKHEWEFVRIFHSKEEAAEYIKLEDQFKYIVARILIIEKLHAMLRFN